jgi:hypothetical protein
MPRLSLYRPNKQNDYRFLDRTVHEMLTVGGTDLYIHKYLFVFSDLMDEPPSSSVYQPRAKSHGLQRQKPFLWV